MKTIPRWWGKNIENSAPMFSSMVMNNSKSPVLWAAMYAAWAPITMWWDAIATLRTVPRTLYNLWADLANAQIEKYNNNQYQKKIKDKKKKTKWKRALTKDLNLDSLPY